MSLAFHSRDLANRASDGGSFLCTTRGSATVPVPRRRRSGGSTECRVHFGAAVLAKKANQVRGLPPIHGVVDEAAGAPPSEQARARQRLEMMGKGGARHLEPPLDVVDAVAFRSRADQQPKDLEPVLLAECAELFDTPLHYVNSSIIEMLLTQVQYQNRLRRELGESVWIGGDQRQSSPTRSDK
jgi:hypothetical protein